jgi:dynein assembly factor 5, axonemal
LNASKILPGILNDISDWVEATRIKSIQLLYIMIWQCETNITQSLETVIQTLFKASHENIDIIQLKITQCAKMLGHFTDPSLTLPITFKTMKRFSPPNPGMIAILDGILIGNDSKKIPFSLIIETLTLINEISLTFDSKCQEKLLNCLETILPITKYENGSTFKDEYEFLAFKVAFNLISLTTVDNDDLNLKLNGLLPRICDSESFILKHVASFVLELKSNCESWNDNSMEPIIFGRLIKDFGLAENVLENVIHILKICLDPLKDVQLRTKFLLLIPDIFKYKKSDHLKLSENEFGYLNVYFDQIINEMIIPNINWKSGRSASAVRMTAMASLAIIFHSDTVSFLNVTNDTLNNLSKIALSCLDDENKSTRLYSCKIFIVLLYNYGQRMSKDELHKFYPEFIKRLDDQTDEIRIEILKVFSLYISTLNNDYDKILYQAHLEMIFENLLLYLDDPTSDFQQKILGKVFLL